MSFKTKIILFFLVLSNNYKSSVGTDTVQNTQHPPTGTWASFINMLNHCTIQVFYYRRNFTSWDTISKQLQDLNGLLNFNFIMENVGDPENRYIRANVTQHDEKGIIQSFPFEENNFNLIFSNYHTAIMFSPPMNPLLRMFGLVAFNEDSDYIIILDYFPGHIHWHFNFYFGLSSNFRLTSILLYSNMTTNALSIVCHTCTPLQQIKDRSDKSFLIKKLFPAKDSTLTQFSGYKKLMTNMNLHPIEFLPDQKFWKIPCSLKHCGLFTPHTTCPVSELMVRLNFTTTNSSQNIVGSAISNKIYTRENLKDMLWSPGLIGRMTWIKHSVDFRQVQYRIYALPVEFNAISMLNIFDVLSLSILIILGSASSLIILKNRKFVFAPIAWTVSIFLQQATSFVIKPGEAKVTRFHVFVTYCVVLFWLFNAFFVGSMFSGEFFSLFTSNRIPQLPRNLKELVLATDIPMFSWSTTFIMHENNREVSTLKENLITQMLEGAEYPQEYRRMLYSLKEKVVWCGELNLFRAARSASLNIPYFGNYTQGRYSIFALIDPSFVHQIMERCFGVFRKYFIISNTEEHLDTALLPWITYRTSFGARFEVDVGYLTEAGITEYWENNFQIYRFLDFVKSSHDYNMELGIPEKNYTNYFQKAILNKRESNSAELAREGEPIELDKTKMLFFLYTSCVGISAVYFVAEKYRFITKLAYNPVFRDGCI
ncbi:hypothetical protein Fcan01_24345 [Folsomia candida]|uniref:Uncharacterized protein n=1 Tax=Folsomia candida TaxID=158441 RepID=A0A226D771_FOLCA|nr:hypothetical protein Fcan01_24345 [Folsomia candida]